MKSNLSNHFTFVPPGKGGRSSRYVFTSLMMLFLSSLMSCENQFDFTNRHLPTGNNFELNKIKSLASLGDLPHTELAMLRASVAPYHNMDKGMAAGYDLETTGYRTQMGFHYLNITLLDNTFELEKPEVLLYAPGPNGKLRFVAVEYLVPIEDLDNPPPAPEGYTGDADVWEINTEFSMWTLHVWVGLHNPDGIFTARNSRLP